MQSGTPEKNPAVTLDEIEKMVAAFLPPLPDLSAQESAGNYADTYLWLARAQHKDKPGIAHPRIALFTARGMPPELETVAELAREANADLKVYELSAETPAFDAQEAARAIAWGMMAVQQGVDLVAVAALSLPPENPSLQNCGSPDIAAALGCIIAARVARVPVMTEGPGAAAAAAILGAMQPGAADHCRDAEDILARKASLVPGGKSALIIPFLKALAQV